MPSVSTIFFGNLQCFTNMDSISSAIRPHMESKCKIMYFVAWLLSELVYWTMVICGDLGANDISGENICHSEKTMLTGAVCICDLSESDTFRST